MTRCGGRIRKEIKPEAGNVEKYRRVSTWDVSWNSVRNSGRNLDYLCDTYLAVSIIIAYDFLT